MELEDFDHSYKTSKVSFWRMVWNWIKLDTRIRIKSIFVLWFMFCSIGSIFANSSDMISTPTRTTARNASLMDMGVTDYLNANQRTIFVVAEKDEDKNKIPLLFTNYTPDHVKFISDARRSSNINLFTDIVITDLEAVDNPKGFKLGYTNQNLNQYTLINAVARAYSNERLKTSLNLFAGLFLRPAILVPRVFIWNVWIFPCSYLFLIIAHFYPLSQWMKSKALVLLNISGVHDIVIWTGFVLFDLVYCLITSLIFSIEEYSHKKVHELGFNFFIIFFFLFLASIAIYLSAVFLAPVFNRPGKFGFFIIFYVIFICIGWIIPGVTGVNPPGNCYFLPSAVIYNFFLNIHHDILNEMSFTNKDPDNIKIFKYEELVGLLIFQIFLYATIFIFIILIIPKEWGLPLIGIKNLFKGTAWKKLFQKSKDYVEDESQPFISVKNLTKIYKTKKNVVAVDNIEFEISKGEVILIIGPNGSGKTTLLQSLTGAIATDSGSISIFGKEGQFLDLQKSTGFCYQDDVFFDNLTVRKHLEFLANIRGVKKEDVADHIDYITTLLDINELLDRYPPKLSAGQKRCVSTAMAFIGSPRLVILDEPTVGVDVGRRQRVWNIASYFKDTTTIIASHSLEEGEAVASRLFVMELGHILFQGSPSDLREKYRCGYRLKIIGEDDGDLDETVNKVLDIVKTVVPDAEVDFERGDSIMIPVSDKIPSLMTLLDEKIAGSGASGYAMSIENLEHVMLRMIANGDMY